MKVKDLGYLPSPGAAFCGKTISLPPGQALRLEVPSAKTGNIGGFESRPQGLIQVVGSGQPNGIARFTIQLPPRTPKGTVISLGTNPLQYSSREPKWLFDFKIKVG